MIVRIIPTRCCAGGAVLLALLFLTSMVDVGQDSAPKDASILKAAERAKAALPNKALRLRDAQGMLKRVLLMISGIHCGFDVRGRAVLPAVFWQAGAV